MTHCSHNFCKRCISECLNRRHTCPCCNAATTINQLCPNKQFDRLISIIHQEKDKASKSYFEKLIASGERNSKMRSSQSDQQRPTNGLSPIEQLFHQHLKRSLLSYEEYYKSLKTKYDNRTEEVKKKYTDMMMEHQAKNSRNPATISVTGNTTDPQIEQWKAQCEAMLAELGEGFDKSVELLMGSYDKYMSSFAPAPQFLPVSVNIHVPSKNIKLKNVHISVTDTARDLKKYLMTKFEQQGDPIVEFTAQNIFVLQNSPVPISAGSTTSITTTSTTSMTTSMTTSKRSDTIELNEEGVPIVQYQPEPGATLILQGKLMCKSDAPKQCFKSIYRKDETYTQDYFTCKDCKTNWICKSCKEVCHSEHNIVDYIQKHEPKWACCYCYKTGKCKLFNKV